jgi:hypothetical protein
MVRDAGLGWPILYLLILGTVCGWVSMMWQALFSAAVGDMSQFGMGPELQQYLPATDSAALRLAQALLLPAIVLILYFIAAGILHLMMMIVGGANQPFETTGRVWAYAWGSASIFQLLPICGGLIALVWGIVVAIIGLAEAHETSAGKSAAAVLLPIVLCCLCIVLAVAILGVGIAQLAS